MRRIFALMVGIIILFGLGPKPAKAGPEGAIIYSGIMITSMIIGGCASMAATAKPDMTPMEPAPIVLPPAEQ